MAHLQEATKASTAVWQHDLEQLFRNAKDRFPDVVWELDGDDEVWAHKAIVYARAPPSFQARYFARNTESTAALSYSSEPADSTPTLLRLTSDISPALFSNELEYLYTGKGFGEAFEFLFDAEHTSSSTTASIASADEPEHAEALRIDKLRKDLVFMWRSRLYSDVRIALTGNFGAGAGAGHEATTAIFSSHRFVLVSRSSYFSDALLAWPRSAPQPDTLTLPAPPFTPASVHFTLGFLYTGTLIFSHRSYDLSTAFAILRAALYLNIPTLHDEIQARIAAEMLHGLFHALLPFPAYEALTQGRWGSGGCRCRQCARRAPRVLEFAAAPDVNNSVLERGARRALVGLFGEGWATHEFAQLPQKLRESLLKGVAKRTTPANALPLLFAAEHALQKRLASAVEPWADVVRDALLAARARVDDVVAREAEAVFASDAWDAVLDDGGGAGFDDAERVEWAMASVLRGVKDDCAPVLYQTLVSSILLRPHPTEPSAPLLPATSPIRVLVEQTRVDLLKWLAKHWLNVRQARGFDPLEGWSLKEISDHIEVSIDDLLSPPSYSSPAKRSHPHLNPSHSRPTSAHPHTHTARADVASEAPSMRVSVLSRVAGSSARASALNNNDKASSVYSLARSTASSSSVSVRSAATASTVSAVPREGKEKGGMSPARRIAEDARRSMALSSQVDKDKERPDSKFADDGDVADAGIDVGVAVGEAPSIVLHPGEEQEQEQAVEGVDEDAGEAGNEASMRDTLQDEDEEGVHSDAASTASMVEEDGHGIVAPKTHTKKTPPPLGRPPSVASTSASSRRSPPRPAAGGTKKILLSLSPAAQRVVKDRDGVRTRTTSAASSVSLSPSIRARTGAPARPGSRGSSAASASRGNNTTPATPKTRLSVKTAATGKTTTTTTAASSSKPGAPPRTPSTATLSRPTSRVSTRSSRSVSGGAAAAARPESSASATTGTSASYRTASAGSASGSSPVSTRKSGSTSRTRTTSTASTVSTMSTLSRRTVSTASAAASTPSERERVRVRRVSGASSVASSVSVASASTRAPPPVRKTVSAGAEKDRHLSPAAAAKARGKATTTARTPKKVGASASVGAVPAPGSGPVAGKKDPAPEESEGSDTGEGEGDETVVLSVPPAVITLPPAADADNAAGGDEQAAPPETTSAVDKVDEPPPPAKTITRGLARVGDAEHKKTSSSASSSSVSTLRRKGSNDTIRTVKSSGLASVSAPSDTPASPPAQPPLPQTHPPPPPPPASPPSRQQQPTSIDTILAQTAPQGAMLEIGIPCIIASKRKRFKAYARYIGEVLGERGPWVGVEVPLPLGDAAWGDDTIAAQQQRDDRPWHDGSWGGVRYFEIGGGVGGSEWEYGYGGEGDRAARRRRLDGGSWWGASSSGGGAVFGGGARGGAVKREGDALSIASERMKRMRSVSPAQSDVSGTESRGLFVRPQQVLYVVDAVGSDL